MVRYTNLINRHGNKENDIKFFKNLLPLNIENVIEPFGGSFAVVRNIYNNYERYKIYVNDTDPILFYIYNHINDYIEFFKICNEWLKHNPRILKNFKDHISTLEYNNNVKEFYLQNRVIRGSMLKPNIKDINFGNIIDLTNNINFSNDDYLLILNKFKNDKNSFIFLDPPYIFQDNSSYDENKGTNGIDSTNILYEILEVLEDDKTEAKIMLVINDLKILRWLFKKFIKGSYDKIYQISKRKDKILIITNYNIDDNI